MRRKPAISCQFISEKSVNSAFTLLRCRQRAKNSIVVDMETEINADIDRLVSLKAEIMDAISRVDCVECRMLLELRYLCFCTWEDIAGELILTSAKIFQFLPGTCRIIRRHAPGRKENLNAREYNCTVHNVHLIHSKSLGLVKVPKQK